MGLWSYMGRRPWMMRISTTTIAITNRRWMKPPRVYELTIPSAQRISSTTNTVHSIVASWRESPCAMTLRIPCQAGGPAGERSAAGRDCVVEDGHLRERFRNLVGEDHAQSLGERHDPALEELVVVGGQGIGREIPRDITIAGLVQIRGRRIEAGEKFQAAGAIPALFP